MKISKIAYELYKQDWIDNHTTREIRLDAMRDYFSETVPTNSTAFNTFEEWIEAFGYDYEIYSSYEEFLNAEYQDEAYIRELLSDEKLIKLYDSKKDFLLNEENVEESLIKFINEKMEEAGNTDVEIKNIRITRHPELDAFADISFTWYLDAYAKSVKLTDVPFSFRDEEWHTITIF